ncbi:hypothetical protein BG011_002409 [Mortierella polycephala]|uniref:Uncharacterized protein n=1 Tax=Mortierella polycephala TaxID=41804 RepID=A0A9P6TTD9_9FUNG|nr:hypothetical protein BG011_002409 [Mortierella polycephala]
MYDKSPIGVAGTNGGLARHRNLSASEIQPADRIAPAIPPTYKGPLPQVKPGEEIVWMKTITTTEYFDDNGGDTARTDVMGESTMNNNINNSANYQQSAHDGPRRHSTAGFLDRLMGRHHNSGDKGKQRM